MFSENYLVIIVDGSIEVSKKVVRERKSRVS